MDIINSHFTDYFVHDWWEKNIPGNIKNEMTSVSPETLKDYVRDLVSGDWKTYYETDLTENIQ